MSAPPTKNPWETADRVSDRIVAVLQEELEKMRQSGNIESLQLLAGQLLALMATFKAIRVSVPLPVHILQSAVDACLTSILESKR